MEEALLEGHLGVTKELLTFQAPDKKYHIGSEKGGNNLIKVLDEVVRLSILIRYHSLELLSKH